jgi:nucleoredoxin
LIAGGLSLVLLLRRSSTATSSSLSIAATPAESSNNNKHNNHRAADDDADSRQLQQDGAFSSFPMLAAQLATNDIVALYFAASWCPMSTPVTALLDELLRTHLFDDAASVAVVYVSSDQDEASFQKYLRDGWQSIPYGSKEQTRLKHEFQTCAKREMEPLGIVQRKGELPSLYILSGKNHQVLVEDGIRDIKELGAGALPHWKELQRRSLEQQPPMRRRINSSNNNDDNNNDDQFAI